MKESQFVTSVTINHLVRQTGFFIDYQGVRTGLDTD